MRNLPWIIIGLLGLAAVLFRTVAFTVNEAEQVVVLEFGKPVGKPITGAGLHFKKPFIQEVRRFDRRLLSWDGAVQEYKTRDKKLIRIDVFARWRITDALKFLKTVSTEGSAQSRLDDFIDAAARDVVASNDLNEVVRDTNRKESEDVPKEERWSVEPIKLGRSTMGQKILERVKPRMPSLGIEVVDVKIKRVNYAEAVRAAVYERMVAERERIAEKFRSEGRGIAAEWEGRRERDLQKIQSQAFREAQEIRAAAEAEAAAIYAKAFGQDEEFYAFWRSLDVYRKVVDSETTMVLPLNSPLLDYLDGPKKSIR